MWRIIDVTASLAAKIISAQLALGHTRSVSRGRLECSGRVIEGLCVKGAMENALHIPISFVFV